MGMKCGTGRSVLVTGGASGIGLATVQALLDEDFTVYAWDRDITGLSNLISAGYPIFVKKVDLLDTAAVGAAAKELLARGPLDIVINNAGVLVPGYFHEQTREGRDLMLDVNLRVVIHITALFLPTMYERNSGHIINISSAAGHLGVPGLAVYCATKFAVLGFTESLRHEARNLGKTGVRFTSVHPNFLKKGLFEGAKLKGLGNILVPRVNSHEDIARAIVRDAIRRRLNVVRRPRSVWLAVFLRGILPDAWFQAAVRFFGVTEGMSSYKGARP